MPANQVGHSESTEQRAHCKRAQMDHHQHGGTSILHVQILQKMRSVREFAKIIFSVIAH